MTREQFFELLDYYFRNVNRYQYEEIKADYEKRFDEGLKAGKSEEAVSTELGSPKKIYEELKEQGVVHPGRKDAENFIDQVTGSVNDFFVGLRKSFLDSENDEEDESSEELVQRSVDFDADILRLEIRAAGADVRIKETDRDDIGIVYTYAGSKDTMTTKTEHRVLKLNTIEPRSGLNKDLETVEEIHVELPEGSDMGINLLLVSGDAELDTGDQDVSISAVSGDLTWKKTGDASVEGRLKTVSGDCDVCAPNAQLYIKTVSGDVYVEEEEQDLIDIVTTSGDAEVCSEREDYTFSAQTVSGEIRVEDSFKQKSRTITKSYEEKSGSGDLEVKMTSVSGDLSFLRKE